MRPCALRPNLPLKATLSLGIIAAMGNRSRQRRPNTAVVDRPPAPHSTETAEAPVPEDVLPSTPVSTPDRRRLVLLVLGLVLITALVFHRTPHNKFLNYDDGIHVFQNKRLNPVTAANVLYFWWHPVGGEKSDTVIEKGLNGTETMVIQP